jgi:riboflavin-specific deaminase-like protein
MEDEAQDLNEFFLHFHQFERPFVTLKIAQTADGYIAAPDGDSQWISGQAAREQVHRWRSRYDAVMVGRNTARLDNPRLTVRHVEGRQPRRIVIDGPMDLPDDLNLFTDQYEEKTIIVTHNREKYQNEADPMLNMLQSNYFRGKTLLVPEVDGHSDLESAMKELAELEVTSILVEAGQSLATALIKQRLVDKLELFISPKLLGGGTRSLLGLGRERVLRVPVDDQGRMRADALPQLSPTTIVCIQAGNVNTGAFDPAPAICAAAHQAGAWIHVDGAFGLWASAAPQRAHLTAGLTEADSWATDAHKWLNVPYDSGIAFCRHPEHLQAAMASHSAAYLLESQQREPFHYTPEMSRRARGVEIWAALRSLGRSGLADLIERNCQYATRFAQGLAAAGHRVLNDVVLNQVLVSFDGAETTNRVIADIQQEGTCWCGGTEWQGHTAMRISVSSWATTETDVERSLEAIIRIGRKHRAGRAAA